MRAIKSLIGTGICFSIVSAFATEVPVWDSKGNKITRYSSIVSFLNDNDSADYKSALKFYGKLAEHRKTIWNEVKTKMSSWRMSEEGRNADSVLEGNKSKSVFSEVRAAHPLGDSREERCISSTEPWKINGASKLDPKKFAGMKAIWQEYEKKNKHTLSEMALAKEKDEVDFLLSLQAKEMIRMSKKTLSGTNKDRVLSHEDVVRRLTEISKSKFERLKCLNSHSPSFKFTLYELAVVESALVQMKDSERSGKWEAVSSEGQM